MYADGIFETVNSAGEEFGEKRLLETVRRFNECSLSELYSELLNESCRFTERDRLEDDVSLVGFRFNHALPL